MDDQVDGAYGEIFTEWASGMRRPPSPKPDMIVREYDTGRALRWTGTEWVDDIVAWVRWALDDDEAYARNAFGDHNQAEPEWTEIWSGAVQVGPHEDVVLTNDSQVSRHMVRHDPARVLREVEAKRRIMAIHHAREFSYLPQVCDGCGYGGICDDPIVEDINDCPELRALAAVYSDHPGYRSEWALR